MEKENLYLDEVKKVDTSNNNFVILVEDIFDNKNLVKDLNKNFYLTMSFRDALQFEHDFKLLNIFDKEYMLVNTSAKLFFSFVTSRYEVFSLNEIKDKLYNMGIVDDDSVYMNRYGILIDSKDVAYLNSYSKIYKESIVYKPFFISVSNFKHSKTPKIKRNDLIDKLSNVVQFTKENMTDINNTVILPEFVVETIDTVGIRLLTDLLNLDSEREWNKMDDKDKCNFVETTFGIKNVADYINFLNKIYKRILVKDKFQFSGFLKVSEKFTNYITNSLYATFL